MAEGLRGADHVLEGEVSLGAQEHFYLETHSTWVRPGEDGEVEILSATQDPSLTQVRTQVEASKNLRMKWDRSKRVYPA